MRPALALLTRLLSVLAAVALIALGVVVLVDLTSVQLGRGRTVVPQRSIDEAARRGWDDRTVALTLIVAALVGLVLLVAGLWRRAGLTVAVAGHPDVGLERRALEQAATRRLARLDGVTGASVRAGRRRVKARLSTSRRLAPTELQARAETELAGALTTYGVELPTDVRIRQPRDGAR